MAGRGSASYDGGRPRYIGTAQPPRGPVLVDSYRQDVVAPREKPRYNPSNPERVQSSVLVDLKDPVQVHLLTETALYDAREFEVLSPEEVDELKKQVQTMSKRIEQIRASLAIQSKYRDAAMAMTKLYASSGTRRKSLLSNRSSGGSEAAEVELEQIQKKCEALAFELWSLEKQIMEPQRRLLQHTAGILQLTHKPAGGRGKSPAPRVPLLNGVPASPESMYTGSNGRDSAEPPDDALYINDTGFNGFLEESNSYGAPRSRQNAIEIPLKSPVREQQKQLQEESERLRDENTRLKQELGSLKTELETKARSGAGHFALVESTEQKLQNFNDRLQEVVVRSNPRHANYRRPPSGRLEPGEMVGSQLDYLERGLITLSENLIKDIDSTKKLQAINLEIQDMVLDSVADHPPPPEAGAELDEQVEYLQFSLRAIESELDRAGEMAAKAALASNESSESKKQEEQAETILSGLWEIMQSGYADMHQQKLERRKMRSDKGLAPDEEDMSDSEAFDPSETYSLSAFSTKVQWLYSQATSLKEQKGVLKRQIKQQRELNSKSDSEKEETLKAKDNELEQSRELVEKTEKDADDLRKKLSETLTELENSQSTVRAAGLEQSAAIKEVQERIRERDAKIDALEREKKAQMDAFERERTTKMRALETDSQSQLKALESSSKSQIGERDAKIATLEAGSKDSQMKLSAAEASIVTITAQLKEANEAKDQATKTLKEREKKMESTQQELDQMTGMMAEFKMEATLAKAELDGAYGSRKERAAEAAALATTSETTKLQSKVETLQPRVTELENELRGTAKDLKDITKQAIDAESKIAELEADLDRVNTAARKEREALLDQLDREKLKVPTAGTSSPGGGRGNTTILTDSYREALRNERKKYEEQLRAEQTNRRKLEDELKQLKKGLGPGKSPLSPR